MLLFIEIFLQKNDKLELYFFNPSSLLQVQHVRAEQQHQGYEDIFIGRLRNRYSTRTLKTHHVAQAYIKLNI